MVNLNSQMVSGAKPISISPLAKEISISYVEENLRKMKSQEEAKQFVLRVLSLSRELQDR